MHAGGFVFVTGAEVEVGLWRGVCPAVAVTGIKLGRRDASLVGLGTSGASNSEKNEKKGEGKEHVCRVCLCLYL